MSTQNRPILIVILICATVLCIGKVEIERIKDETSEAISSNAVSEDIVDNITSEDVYMVIESTKSETTKEPQKEIEVAESSQNQSSEQPSSDKQLSSEQPTSSIEVESSETESSKLETTSRKDTADHDDCDVPSNNSIKSYMDYRCITLRSSKQYKLQQSLAYTNDIGLRMVGDRYCVAVGSYYTTTIGQHIDIELKNGNVIKGILADCKADAHTDSTNRINPNGSVVEFVVDTKTLDSTAKKMGDISYVNGWNSKVVNIKVYDFVEKF